MEQRPFILFGNFSEHETYQYFSDESLKSSGIEFPDDFFPFVHLKYDSSTVEEAKVAVTDKTKGYLIDKQYEVAGPNDEKEDGDIEHDGEENAWQTTKQVSDNVVDCSVDKSPQSISEEKEQTVPENEQNFNQEDVSRLEKGPLGLEQNGELHPIDVGKLNNVVTVGTDTLMTNTTTVGSGHNQGSETKKSSTWADLFKTKSSSKPQDPLPTSMKLSTPDSKTTTEGSNKDQFRHYFLDVLKKTRLTNNIPHLQPRGLKNNANWCYINATLQVLMFCPSFYHFLIKFKLTTDRGRSCTPILDALVVFVSQFSKMPPRQSVSNKEWSKQDVVMGMPFEPTYVYDLLTQVKTSLSQQGKQEDAEEFLSFILNGLHEELVHLESPEDKQEFVETTNNIAPEQNSKANEDSMGEWEEVGPRNKSTVTRKSTMVMSPVAKMFGGYLRSSLLQHGVKESASIQPFYSIQLDLRGDVSTVQQAFDHFFSIEEVEGFQCDQSKMEVEVSKKWTLDSLPNVLILHLKRFVVNKHKCEKLTKKISYESELQIPQDTLSKSLKIRNKNMLAYKLFAITYHHGKNLYGGHYTSDIYHPAIGWLRADDGEIRIIPAKFVFNPLSNRDPYLLYYRRGDIPT